MNKLQALLPTVARVLLGLVFFLAGLAALLHLVPKPSTPLPEGATAFAEAMMKTGYLFPLLKITETVAGALLLFKRCVPLALILLAPIVVNIVAFHAFLEPSGIPVALVILLLELYLAWVYRNAFRPLFPANPA